MASTSNNPSSPSINASQARKNLRMIEGRVRDADVANGSLSTCCPTSNQNPPSSSSAMRLLASPLKSVSLGLQSLPPSTSSVATVAGSHRQMLFDHRIVGTEPVVVGHQVLESTSAAGAIARIRSSDIVPYEGAPCSAYVRAVEALSGSLTRHNAVVIELESEEVALIRCAFEWSRLYFRIRGQSGGGSCVKIGTRWVVLREFGDGEERMIKEGSDERMERRERDCCACERMRVLRWVLGWLFYVGEKVRAGW